MPAHEITVVFDLGDVLVPAEGLERGVAAELGVPEDAVRTAYWAHRAAHDRGEPPTRYWRAVLTDLGLDPTPETMARVEAFDVARWSTLPSASTLLLGELARARVRLALLSNAPSGLAAAVRAAAWSSPFDRLLFSADVGVTKPSPDIYARADQVYGTRPDQVIFFDDRPENVRAALLHGWDAHRWTGIPAATRTLRARGVLGGARPR